MCARARVIARARALACLSKRLLLLFSSAVDPDAEGRLGGGGIWGSDNKKNWRVPIYNIQYLTVSVRSEFEFSPTLEHSNGFRLSIHGAINLVPPAWSGGSSCVSVATRVAQDPNIAIINW